MNDVSRRSFLFGAVAVPAGIALPAALARELALPPPEQAAVGQSLILLPGRMGAVLDVHDLMNGQCDVTLVDGKKVMGVFRVVETRMEVSPSFVDVTRWNDSASYHHYKRGINRTELSFTLVEMVKPLG